MGHIAFDPLLADITKGPISICIVADYEQETAGIEWKSMLTSPNCSQPPFHPPSPLRTELLIEQTLLNSLNSPSPKLATYKSLLSLKIIDKNRIIEGTNNIKTNRYQILRWILDRHFENTYEVKLRAEIGDEVENYVAKSKRGFCSIM